MHRLRRAGSLSRQLEFQRTVVSAHDADVGEVGVGDFREQADALLSDVPLRDFGAEVAARAEANSHRSSLVRDLFPLVGEEEVRDGVTVAHVEALDGGASGAGEVPSALDEQGTVQGGGEEGTDFGGHGVILRAFVSGSIPFHTFSIP